MAGQNTSMPRTPRSSPGMSPRGMQCRMTTITITTMIAIVVTAMIVINAPAPKKR